MIFDPKLLKKSLFIFIIVPTISEVIVHEKYSKSKTDSLRQAACAPGHHYVIAFQTAYPIQTAYLWTIL